MRKFYGKCGAFSIGTLHINGSAHQFQISVYDGKTKTGTFDVFIFLLVKLREAVKEVLHGTLFNADTGIGNNKLQSNTVLIPARNFYKTGHSAFSCVLDRIVQYID